MEEELLVAGMSALSVFLLTVGIGRELAETPTEIRIMDEWVVIHRLDELVVTCEEPEVLAR